MNPLRAEETPIAELKEMLLLAATEQFALASTTILVILLLVADLNVPTMGNVQQINIVKITGE